MGRRRFECVCAFERARERKNRKEKKGRWRNKVDGRQQLGKEIDDEEKKKKKRDQKEKEKKSKLKTLEATQRQEREKKVRERVTRMSLSLLQ